MSVPSELVSSPDFSMLFEAAPSALLVLLPNAPAYTIVAVSNAYLKATMTTREGLLGLPLFAAFPDNPSETAPTGVANLRASLDRAIATGAPDRMPVQKYGIRKPGGQFEERYGTLLNTPVLDATGEVRYLMHQVEDVTSQVQAEAELRDSENRFRLLADAIPQIVWVTDPDGHVEFFNRQWSEYTGEPYERTTADEVAARFLHPDDGPATGAAFEQARRTGTTFAVEHRIRSRDGKYRWFLVRAEPYRNPITQQIVQWFGASIDIDDCKGAEAERERLLQQIEAERHRLEQVFAQAPVAIAVFRGRDLVVELANPVYQALLQSREVVGRRFTDVMPDLGQEVWDVFHRVMDTGEPYATNEWHIPYDYDQDGILEDHWFNVAYHPLLEPDKSVSGFVSVLTEVTTQVLARKELERVNSGLEEFAHVASHDLQEPLRMVHSYSQLLIRRLGDDATEEQREFAELIRAGVKRMERLIKDLLAYSRIIHTGAETTRSDASLNEALTQALITVETRIEETGAIVTHDALPTVGGDTAQLTHVFQNLLSNALKYRKPNEPPRIHITAQSKTSEWVISVRDNGIGFDPSQAERIFGLFKRLHRDDQYPGTGLGLAICQRIIERFGGRMWAESEPGRGSTFFFSLPRLP